MEQKTVFISYRRNISKHLARAIYQDLKTNGWDVFLDVDTIDSGDFDRIILNQIGARAHFVLLISTGSLERCANDGDWVLREIQEAVRLNRNIVPIIEDGADFNHELSFLPADVRTIISVKNYLPLTHFYFDAGVEKLRTRFLRTPEYITITASPEPDSAEVQRRMARIDVVFAADQSENHNSSFSSLAWIEIPDKDYSISKYPVTNEQYALFKADNGYHNQEWWLASGWQERMRCNWKAPRYWHDPRWNRARLPVVGVSWHEAVAFARWLSRTLGYKIELPTEEQWQYSAQGDDMRPYPWGMIWNPDRCNSSAGDVNWGQTSPVTQYEDIGASPFGVVDMLGNVWEWCMDWDKEKKTLRGGCWRSKTIDIQKRTERRSVLSSNMWGFRLVKY